MNLLRKYCAINYWNGLKYNYKSFSYFQLFLIPSPVPTLRAFLYVMLSSNFFLYLLNCFTTSLGRYATYCKIKSNALLAATIAFSWRSSSFAALSSRRCVIASRAVFALSETAEQKAVILSNITSLGLHQFYLLALK